MAPFLSSHLQFVMDHVLGALPNFDTVKPDIPLQALRKALRNVVDWERGPWSGLFGEDSELVGTVYAFGLLHTARGAVMRHVRWLATRGRNEQGQSTGDLLPLFRVLAYMRRVERLHGASDPFWESDGYTLRRDFVDRLNDQVGALAFASYVELVLGEYCRTAARRHSDGLGAMWDAAAAVIDSVGLAMRRPILENTNEVKIPDSLPVTISCIDFITRHFVTTLLASHNWCNPSSKQSWRQGLGGRLTLTPSHQYGPLSRPPSTLLPPFCRTWWPWMRKLSVNGQLLTGG